jgi:hypothetical protein
VLACVRACARQVPLFANKLHEELVIVAEALEKLSVREHSTVVAEGEVGDCMYHQRSTTSPTGMRQYAY